MGYPMCNSKLRSFLHLLAPLALAASLMGCGGIGTAAGVTYAATKTTVKAAGGAVKWAYRGTRNAYRKVTDSDEDSSDYDETYAEGDMADQDHTASTTAIRLPEVVEHP